VDKEGGGHEWRLPVRDNIAFPLKLARAAEPPSEPGWTSHCPTWTPTASTDQVRIFDPSDGRNLTLGLGVSQGKQLQRLGTGAPG
jgi:hypothetical protein